jgi:hypothetical protein
MYDHDQRLPDQSGDRRNVLNEIEIELFVKARIHRVIETGHQKRVAIGGRARHRFGGDIAAGADAVFDDKRLAKMIREIFADQTRGDVGRAAGGKADDEARRPRRIGLRHRSARQDRHHGGRGGQRQEFAALNRHSMFLDG